MGRLGCSHIPSFLGFLAVMTACGRCCVPGNQGWNVRMVDSRLHLLHSWLLLASAYVALESYSLASYERERLLIYIRCSLSLRFYRRDVNSAMSRS